MELLGIEMKIEEFDKLMCEQSKGKELIVENGRVIARDRVKTQKEINEQRKYIIKLRLEEITKDLAQVQCGLVVPDIDSKKTEFQRLLNEIRSLENKQPREIQNKKIIQ